MPIDISPVLAWASVCRALAVSSMRVVYMLEANPGRSMIVALPGVPSPPMAKRSRTHVFDVADHVVQAEGMVSSASMGAASA